MHKITVRLGLCPDCQSKYIRRHYLLGYKCHTCDFQFATPDRVTEKPKRGGSGIITPLTYRQQITRARLAELGTQIKTGQLYFGKKS